MNKEKNKIIYRIGYFFLLFNVIALLFVVNISRNTQAQSCVDTGWPPGHYCILRAGGLCPIGFTGNGNGMTAAQPGFFCADTTNSNDLSEVGPNVGDAGYIPADFNPATPCEGAIYLRFCCK